MLSNSITPQHFCSSCCGFRFKEEAEGSLADLKEQVAGAQQERQALEQQAKAQVFFSWPLLQACARTL